MTWKISLAAALSLGIFTGCAYRAELPARNVAYVAPEPVAFDVPFGTSPQYAATMEGGPHYTEGPVLNRWAPKGASEVEGKRGQGAAPVNAKQDRGEGAVLDAKPLPSAEPAKVVERAPAPRPPVARQLPPPAWNGQATDRDDDPIASTSR